jgi:hypothetical protein
MVIGALKGRRILLSSTSGKHFLISLHHRIKSSLGGSIRERIALNLLTENARIQMEKILAVFIVACGRRPKTGVLFDCYGLLPSIGKIAHSWAAMSPGFFRALVKKPVAAFRVCVRCQNSSRWASTSF